MKRWLVMLPLLRELIAINAMYLCENVPDPVEMMLLRKHLEPDTYTTRGAR